MEHVLNILTLAEKSERIGIILGPESGDAELLAAHAIKEKLGEKAIILNAPEHLQDRWSHMFKKERARKEFALALDTVEHPVDELRYEKEGGKLRIFLSPRHELTKDAFELEQRYPSSDAIIALGFASETDIARMCKEETPLKNPDALINLSRIPSPPPSASGGGGPTPQAEPAPQLHQWDIGAMKLWSRALLRSYTEENTNVFWVFLPKEDFQKTAQSANILPALVADMRTIMELPMLCIVLWQDQDSPTDNVHILVSGRNREAMTQLAEETETPLANGNLFLRGFANFSEAEVEMRKLLKHITHST